MRAYRSLAVAWSPAFSACDAWPQSRWSVRAAGSVAPAGAPAGGLDPSADTVNAGVSGRTYGGGDGRAVRVPDLIALLGIQRRSPSGGVIGCHGVLPNRTAGPTTSTAVPL